LPVIKLPTSYRFCGLDVLRGSGINDGSDSNDEDLNNPTILDFAPHQIGTDDNPLESADGTVAILHLVCLTLPKMAPFDSSVVDDSSIHDRRLFYIL
jgi:hypothetical protein